MRSYQPTNKTGSRWVKYLKRLIHHQLPIYLPLLILLLLLLVYFKDTFHQVGLILNLFWLFKIDFKSAAMRGKNFENGKSEPKANNIYPSFVKNLKEYLFEYSANSSLHCVRYLGEKKRSYVERYIGVNLKITG